MTKPMFRNILDHPEFQRMVAVETRRFAAGETIIEEGALGTEVFLILSGKAEVYVAIDQLDKSGRKAGIAKIFENGIIGELALFDHEPRTASVIAASDCELAVMDGKALTAFMDAHPSEGYWIIKDIFAEIVRRMRQATLRSNTITALYLNDYSD